MWRIIPSQGHLRTIIIGTSYCTLIIRLIWHLRLLSVQGKIVPSRAKLCNCQRSAAMAEPPGRSVHTLTNAPCTFLTSMFFRKSTVSVLLQTSPKHFISKETWRHDEFNFTMEVHLFAALHSCTIRVCTQETPEIPEAWAWQPSAWPSYSGSWACRTLSDMFPHVLTDNKGWSLAQHLPHLPRLPWIEFKGATSPYKKKV